MSMIRGMGRTADVGEKVASFRDYDGALKAVSQLIEAEVPARDIAIVGTALRSVERVTGRLGWAQAAWSGALNGVLLGLFFGAMVVIWIPAIEMAAFAGMLLLGIAMGMVFRLANYMVVRRRRDFASVMQVTADHYEVSVQRASLAKAKQVLGARPAAPAPVDPRTIAEPQRFGVRVDPTTGQPMRPAAPEPDPASREPERTPEPRDRPASDADSEAGPASDAGHPASEDRPGSEDRRASDAGPASDDHAESGSRPASDDRSAYHGRSASRD